MTNAFRLFPLSSQIVVGQAAASAGFNAAQNGASFVSGRYDFAAAEAAKFQREFGTAGFRQPRIYVAPSEGDGTDESEPPRSGAGGSGSGGGEGKGARSISASLSPFLTGSVDEIQAKLAVMESYDELFATVARDAAIPSLKFEPAEAAAEQIVYFGDLLSALGHGLAKRRSNHESMLRILHFAAKSIEESTTQLLKDGRNLTVNPNSALLPLLRATDTLERRILFKGTPSDDMSRQLAAIYDIVARKGLSYEAALTRSRGHESNRYFTAVTVMQLMNVCRRYAKLEMHAEAARTVSAMEYFNRAHGVPESGPDAKAWVVREFAAFVEKKAAEAFDSRLTTAEGERRFEYLEHIIDIAKRGNFLFSEEVITSAAGIAEHHGMQEKADELRSWLPFERLFADKMGMERGN